MSVLPTEKRSRLIPRGIRNNNPLNIRIGNVWLGEVSNPTDPEFEQFVSMKYGLRAAFVLLRRYIRHYHRETIADIISAWAPKSENDTLRYIDSVSRLANIPPNAPLKFEQEPHLVSLVMAMAKVETGRDLDEKLVIEAYRMA